MSLLLLGPIVSMWDEPFKYIDGTYVLPIVIVVLLLWGIKEEQE